MSDTTTVQVSPGDVWEMMPGKYKERERFEVVEWSSSHTLTQFADGTEWRCGPAIYAVATLIRRAAPEVAKAPEGPPVDYKPCEKRCGRWTDPKSPNPIGGVKCNHCFLAEFPRTNTLASLDASYGPDWTPPGWRPGMANTPKPPIGPVPEYAKAKPAEAKCITMRCPRPPTLRHVGRLYIAHDVRTALLCDPCYLAAENMVAKLNGGIKSLPANYTIPKPSPYVCGVDDWDLLPDAGR